MSRFRLSVRALRDLLEIRELVSRSSVTQAARLTERLFAEFDRLVRMPGIGRTRADLGDARLRSWVVFDYLVLYLVVDQDVRVVRVVHGHMDLRELRLEDNDWPDGVREARLSWGLAAAG
jgi:plasmid stabilization system protein ParE